MWIRQVVCQISSVPCFLRGFSQTTTQQSFPHGTENWQKWCLDSKRITCNGIPGARSQTKCRTTAATFAMSEGRQTKVGPQRPIPRSNVCLSEMVQPEHPVEHNGLQWFGQSDGPVRLAVGPTAVSGEHVSTCTYSTQAETKWDIYAEKHCNKIRTTKNHRSSSPNWSCWWVSILNTLFLCTLERFVSLTEQITLSLSEVPFQCFRSRVPSTTNFLHSKQNFLEELFLSESTRRSVWIQFWMSMNFCCRGW